MKVLKLDVVFILSDRLFPGLQYRNADSNKHPGHLLNFSISYLGAYSRQAPKTSGLLFIFS